MKDQRSYCLYGVRLRSVLSLPGPELESNGDSEITLFHGSAGLFSGARRRARMSPEKGDWFRYARLSDGSEYVKWSGLFEFLVSPDGRRIACRELDGASAESFQTYLLGQVLSYALLKQGIEPLHSTSVVIDGKAVAFLGDCGYGKSSLGAAFLQVGYRVLTDDLLVLKEQVGQFVAYPGPPRIKLFPEIAKSLLGDRVSSSPMNNDTPKLVIPLHRNESVRPEGAIPLKGIYVLGPPRKIPCSHKVTIRSLSPRRAFIELTRNTFNPVIVEPDRLKRQFVLASRIASRVPVKSLSYGRTLARLPEVQKAVLSDLK